jgi:hypothetical protein
MECVALATELWRPGVQVFVSMCEPEKKLWRLAPPEPAITQNTSPWHSEPLSVQGEVYPSQRAARPNGQMPVYSAEELLQITG